MFLNKSTIESLKNYWENVCREVCFKQDYPSRHLLVRSQQCKHKNSVWNLFKANKKEICVFEHISNIVLVIPLLTLGKFKTCNFKKTGFHQWYFPISLKKLPEQALFPTIINFKFSYYYIANQLSISALDLHWTKNEIFH